ncbi:MAG: acyl-CoA dehydrogenase, partial [Elusimicrobia bacterium]|nr:acyl-CoA dehydrogenase [Elusimicrobiota bacterium]
MSPADDTAYGEIRSAIRDICGRFGDEYWREGDRLLRYPSE